MRALALLCTGLLLAGCAVDLEGAPCEQDSNCPRAQWCQLDGTCTSRTPTLAEACELVVEMATRKTASCYTGRVEGWREEIPSADLCAAIAASEAAGTLGFEPTTAAIRQCKASLIDGACEALSVPTALTDCELFPPASSVGQPCGTPYDCADGWCEVSSTCPGTCRAFVEDDQACAAGDRCRPGSVCASDGFCRPYGRLGDDCSAARPCDPYLALCSGNPGTCVARKLSGGCSFNECAPTYRCSPPLFGGTCNPARAVGEPCTPGQYQCEALAHCSNVTNQCEPVSAVGGSCGLNFEGEIVLVCLGSRCDGNSCANHVAIGQACNNDTECGPLARCDGVCLPQFCN